MFCSRCGLRVDEGARFCQGCGQEAIPASVPLPVQTSIPVYAPLPYAGFWVRFVASLIDGLILGIPFLLVFLAMFFLFGGFRVMARIVPGRPPDPAFIGIIFSWFFLAVGFGLVAQWLYFAGMESSARQATFGKAAMSLRVTGLEGQQLTFGHASGRFFSKLISGMIPLAIGYIMAAFTEKKQALHDMIAGTLVLRKL